MQEEEEEEDDDKAEDELWWMRWFRKVEISSDSGARAVAEDGAEPYRSAMEKGKKMIRSYTVQVFFSLFIFFWFLFFWFSFAISLSLSFSAQIGRAHV